MNEVNVSREHYLNHLKKGECRVIFTKSNGEERVMRATLLNTLITSEYEKKTERVKKVNEDVIAVYDLDNQSWRSFNINTVKNFQPL